MEKNLLLFFDRPCEPVFVPKGEQKITFEVPSSYLAEEYQPIAQRILTRYSREANDTIPIRQITIPDMRIPLSIGRREAFSLFIPSHRKAAAYLTELFMGMRTVEDLISLAAYSRDRVNPHMYIYSLSVAILHRSDTKHLNIPQLSEIFPDKYLDSAILSRARETSNVVPAGLRLPIEIPLELTTSANDLESRLAYFREDVGINLHYWHWHLVYPSDGPSVTVNKDRRGELFYYMHHQVMARFNTERICNGLALVKPLQPSRGNFPLGYFPKLSTYSVSSCVELWSERILAAIHRCSALTSTGIPVPLDEHTGIDTLGNMVESSALSPYRNYYGDLHNLGHFLLPFNHDPDHRYLEAFAGVGDNATAMRDPIFYEWQAFIDLFFQKFLDSLPPYTEQQLAFHGVTVQDIRIENSNANPNTLNCHWSKSDIDLSRGLDFIPRGAIVTRVKHLDHDAFTYSFTINNSNNQDVMGTVRVFVAPESDENGRALSQNEQRLLMIEMDKFTTRLTRGQNVVTRNSTDSAVTIPFESTFRNVDQNRPEDNDLQNFDAFNFCGCGWPQHMLVPKGTEQGFAMVLFVMVSDYQQDRVDQDEPTGCRDGVSYCGLQDRKYPDRRGMGFPFDRKARSGVNSMSNFLTPNMRLQRVTVRFYNTIKLRQSGSTRAVARQ